MHYILFIMNLKNIVLLNHNNDANKTSKKLISWPLCLGIPLFLIIILIAFYMIMVGFNLNLKTCFKL